MKDIFLVNNTMQIMTIFYNMLDFGAIRTVKGKELVKSFLLLYNKEIRCCVND